MKYKVRKFFNVNGYGAYVLIANIIMILITLILYPCFYAGNKSIWDLMSWSAFYVLLVGLVIGSGLLFLFKGKFSSLVLMPTTLVAFGLFVLKTYQYISAAFVGIDSQFTPQFIILFILFIINVILSFIAFFKTFNFEKENLNNEEK